MPNDYQFGITQSFTCNYLPEEEERLLVAVDERLHNTEQYSWLMANGFRRSGSQIYRPHCMNCSACKSIRVISSQFVLSKSQKRLMNKNKTYSLKISHEAKDIYYGLYENYINTIHHDGSMFPASMAQYETFTQSNVSEQLFIETWDGDKLISVAVTDILVDALSAVYTFYHPDYRSSGLGIFSILNQIKLTNDYKKTFLYLGYQIDSCQKMNYKNKYYPYQELIENSWITTNK
jgi:arginine-tRNA-protein transferase